MSKSEIILQYFPQAIRLDLAPTPPMSDLMGLPFIEPCDIFVESDKDGRWYVVGTSDNQKVPRHNGQPSKAHAINLGIQFFWSEPF
jgi:hypothetical protein